MEKNAMRAREPNSWPIRCHRTWSGTGSQLPKYNSTCWRWKIITSQLLMLLIRWTTRTIEWTFMTNCPSSLKTFLLCLQVRRTLKGVFCVRPAYSSKQAAHRSQKQNDQLSHCKCELIWNWTKKYWRTQESMPLCELWNFNFNENEL